jgi:hypothetical protein
LSIGALVEAKGQGPKDKRRDFGGLCGLNSAGILFGHATASGFWSELLYCRNHILYGQLEGDGTVAWFCILDVERLPELCPFHAEGFLMCGKFT